MRDARRPLAACIPPHPIPLYIIRGGGVGCEGLCGGSLLLCHEDNQLINRLECAVKTAFHVPY